jgi:hypothetical protein
VRQLGISAQLLEAMRDSSLAVKQTQPTQKQLAAKSDLWIKELSKR